MIKHLRPEMLSTAPNYIPEVVSDLSQNFKKMLDSCPQELKDELPIPVNMGILERAEFLAP
jgi:hypothetical protein